MWNMIYISLECIVNIAFQIALLLILFRFKRERRSALVVFGLFSILTSASSLWASLHESDPDFVMQNPIYIILDILFYYGFPIFFFYRYVKGPAFRNCGLFLIFSVAALPFMILFHLLRKYFMLGPAILEAQSPKDFAALLITAASFGIALLLAVLVRRGLWRKLEQIPSVILGGIYLVDSVIALASGLSERFQSYAIGDVAASVNLAVFFCIGLNIWLLTAIVVFFLYDRLNIRKNRRMLQVEMDLQHTYYKSIVTLQFEIRGLRHDLINHLNVLEHLDLMKSAYVDPYCQSFLSYCDQIERKAAEAFRWQALQLQGLTDRECCILYYYLKSLTDRYGADWEVCRIYRDQGSGCQLIFEAPWHDPQPFWQIRLRKDPLFQLIQSMLLRKNGKAYWKKGEKQWQFILTLSS